MGASSANAQVAALDLMKKLQGHSIATAERRQHTSPSRTSSIGSWTMGHSMELLAPATATATPPTPEQEKPHEPQLVGSRCHRHRNSFDSAAAASSLFGSRDLLAHHLFRSGDSTDRALADLVQSGHGDGGGDFKSADSAAFSIGFLEHWASARASPRPDRSWCADAFRATRDTNAAKPYGSLFSSRDWSGGGDFVEPAEYARIFQTRGGEPNSAAVVALHDDDDDDAIDPAEPPLADEGETNALAVVMPIQRTPVSAQRRCRSNKRKSPARDGSASAKKTKVPGAKRYIAGPFTDADVLMGRGGLSNRHVGNQAYLCEKELMQTRYLDAAKDDKTGISQELVDRVHARGGRFLKLDAADEQVGGQDEGDGQDEVDGMDDNGNGNGRRLGRWYEVDATTARKKASQTLREVNTPENRARKRAKYSPRA